MEGRQVERYAAVKRRPLLEDERVGRDVLHLVGAPAAQLVDTATQLAALLHAHGDDTVRRAVLQDDLARCHRPEVLDDAPRTEAVVVLRIQREDECRVDILPPLARGLALDLTLKAVHELDSLKAAAELLVEEALDMICQIRFPCP